jgi:hypothetical protein
MLPILKFSWRMDFSAGDLLFGDGHADTVLALGRIFNEFPMLTALLELVSEFIHVAVKICAMQGDVVKKDRPTRLYQRRIHIEVAFDTG